MTVNLARYKPTGEYVAIRRIDLDSCTNDMVNYIQVSTGDSRTSLTIYQRWTIHLHLVI